MKRKLILNRKQEYKLEINKYVRVIREKDKRYEKDIVGKCKEEPKLFYIFIKEKYNIQSINRLKDNKEVYKDLKEMKEVLNKNFQKAFRTKSDF